MPTAEKPLPINHRNVLRYMFDNPESTPEDRARNLGITGQQIDAVIRSLREDRHLISMYQARLSPLGYKLRYRVDIWVVPGKLFEAKGGLPGDNPDDQGINSQKTLALYILRTLPKRFEDSVVVEDVQILLGSPADISATVVAKSVEDMLRFVTEGIRMCGAVYQTATCLEGWSFRRGDPES